MKRVWGYLCALASFGSSGGAANKSAANIAPTGTSAAGTPINVGVDEAVQLLAKQPKMLVLDVRTVEEFAEGHIKGATNISFFDPQFQQKVALLNKDQPILVHCATGGRSAKARNILAKQNFKSIYHLDGGISAWQKAKQPVQK